ncbi:hypothetical protein CDES_02100 [Corynebacterium deserti GIMN1.010]|uniref:Uncharacterized protein n=1 Tax=Corynebacterium deserti GIMN1.010 TaxID=931089 RepID=A0A0M4CVZ5_9CORY|nr:CGLAU_01105 family protein [Corynebacterium deserti]ALC04882.1 hypothetical protein CDES_02100 [Corynebacterium deserti GIMN1.010]
MSDAKDDSILSKWSKAASELGDAASKVAKNVREELSEKETLSKLKAEASEARDQAKSGSVIDAGKEFAKDAGHIFKDVANTVRGAVSDNDNDGVKSAFSSAVEASRDKFDDAVDKRAEKRAEKRTAKNDSAEPGDDDIIDGEVISPQN